MAEKSSSASGGKYSKLFQAGDDGGKDSKSKKRRRRKQKKEKLTEKSLENVQAAESSVLSTVEQSESNFKELVQKSGEHESSLGQAVENEPTAESVQDSGVLESSASNAEGTSDSRKDLPSEEKLVTGKGKEQPTEERADASDDGEGKASADKSLEQQQTSTKNKMDLLSFGRLKKNKTQRVKSAAQKASGEKNRNIKDSVGAEGDSSGRTTKSKFLGEESEQEPGEDREMAEPETSAIKEADNSPEDVKTDENNEGQIDEDEKAREAMNAAGSNKAKKFKPLASFRRHKKKADPAKSASADENIEEKAEIKQHLKAGCDEVFDDENGDKVSNNEDEKAESNENAKKKSTGKKFGPLRSFRRSKASKKSTEEGRADSAGKAKEKNENSQEKDVAEGENCQDTEVLQHEHGAQQSAVPEGLSEECTGEENPELIPEEEEIPDKRGADADAEAMTPTKKEKKKGLLRRQMKKIWSTSGKTKEDKNTEKAEEQNVADEVSEAQGDNGDQQVSSENPPTPAEANSEGREATEELATEKEEFESAEATAEEKIERVAETNLEAALIECPNAEMHSTEKTEKTASLFGRQIRKIKKSKENQTKKGDEETLIEEATGASGADNREATKQVKRKRSGFQKISNALKKKKSSEEGWQNEDEIDSGQGPVEKKPQETDRQIASAEVNQAEDEEQHPINHDKAHAEGREIHEGDAENALIQSDQEETEKINDSEESPSEDEKFSESVERQENCQGASAVEAFKAHGNLMKPVIQELLAKMAKWQAVRASAPAEPEIESEEDSEFTKTSDDYSLTEVTSTTGDSTPSFADACNDDKVSEDSAKLEGKPQERDETEGDHEGKSTDDTKDADAAEDSAECVPRTPEAERERPDEAESIEIPTCDDGSAVDTSIPETVPNATEAEASGKRTITEDVENVEDKDSEIRRGSDDSEEGDNEESEEEQKREITKSEDLDKSDAGVTSDLDSSQTAPSKGRKEDWILVNHLEISQELSHQLKVLALDSFEHGTPGCCSMM